MLSVLLSQDGGSLLKPSDIGVVTPYKAQEKLLHSVLQGVGGARDAPEVATIDSFQADGRVDGSIAGRMVG